MVSFPDGETGNNALGYCTSDSRDPNRSATLTPLGTAWQRWALKGTKVAVKWLKLAGEPEFLHELDGETSTTTRLPRRLRQRSAVDLVTIRTSLTQHSFPSVALHYGSASGFTGNFISVAPLGQWQCNLPAGAAVQVMNLSEPRNALKNGAFGVQASVAKNTSAAVRLLKDSPGG
ncbi:hypothetical protein C0Z18_19455 [Trinickia dabaoshanensis]|uniref:Uncharacterized protein n=2 Tax=Trinickia dabaoshanensis TaxID=564714 RepID=A0A2N7VKG5_9BURK|nr:hypothetical protein C0Z18_19455 [Trinickia dabaoshanensis]